MRGYFGLGVEGLSKPMNAGNLFRSAHAFGASFIFAIGGTYSAAAQASDTSDAPGHVPFYSFADVESMRLPSGCKLVGVELLDEAVDLPSFRHPLRAAYVLGPERGSLSPGLVSRCDHIVKVPTRFCINVAVAGAIVLYDRQVSLGRFAARPVRPGMMPEALPLHVHGGPVFRKRNGRSTRGGFS
jgi:tRNA G18 (ribose-2'-O)-methylase SpoU